MGFFKNRKCKNCGVEFEPKNPTQKFCDICSIENKKKGNRERQKRWREKNIKKVAENNRKAYLKRKENTKKAK